MRLKEMFYIHKDYLGSFETVTDGSGQVREKLSFDPCSVKLGFRELCEPETLVELIPPALARREGRRRRNPTDWTYDNVPANFLFDRGFTGHEHLDNFDLINMNGRVYDPWLGRFLSPDPFVQAPTNAQNFNRYSYALNNPLKYVDPSGYTYGPPRDFKLGRGAFAPKTSPFYINNGFIHLKNTPMFMNMGIIDEAGHFETFVQATDWYTKVTTKECETTTYDYTTYKFTTEWVWNDTDWGYSSWKTAGDGSTGGGLTWSRAKAHYQFGGGTRIDVALSSIDLSRVSLSDFDNRGLATIRLDSKHFSSANDALVHGTITLQLIGPNTAKIALNSGRDFPQLKGQPAGMYNFEMQSWGNAINWLRNPETFLGGLINGIFLMQGPTGPLLIYTGGTPFPIYYHGSVTISQ